MGLTREELQAGTPIIGIAQVPGSDPVARAIGTISKCRIRVREGNPRCWRHRDESRRTRPGDGKRDPRRSTATSLL